MSQKKEPEYKWFHRIGSKIRTNGKIFQKIVVKCKNFVPQTKVCGSRKHKFDMTIVSKAKDCASVNFPCVDFSCLLCIQLKNDDYFSIPWKNLRDYYWKFNIPLPFWIWCIFKFFIIWVDFFVSSYKKLLIAVGILIIQIRSLESLYGTLIFSEVMIKNLQFYLWQAPMQIKAWDFLM